MEKRKIRRFEVSGKYTNSWYRMTAFPSKEGLTILGQEITERKKAEERLKYNEEKFRETSEYLENLLRYANAPIICWDSRFRITIFNHAFEHLTGYKQDQIIGKNLRLLFTKAISTPKSCKRPSTVTRAVEIRREYMRREARRGVLLFPRIKVNTSTATSVAKLKNSCLSSPKILLYV